MGLAPWLVLILALGRNYRSQINPFPLPLFLVYKLFMQIFKILFLLLFRVPLLYNEYVEKYSLNA